MLYRSIPALWIALVVAPAAFAQSGEAVHLPHGVPGSREVTAQRVMDRLLPASTEHLALLVERERQVWTGSEWTPDLRSVFVYEDLHRTEQRRYQWSGQAWQSSSRTRFTREGSGVLVETREQWDESARTFLPVNRYEYQYAPGQTIFSTVLYRTWIGDAWEDDARTTNILSDIGGNTYVTGGLTESWTGTGWIPMDQFVISAHGGDLIYTSQLFTGADWVNREEIVFHSITHSELQDRVSRIMHLFVDFGGLNIGAHLVPAHTSRKWEEAGWVNAERLVHESLDPSGEPASIRYETWTGAEWEAHMRQSVTYYEARPTTIMFGTFDGREWYAARVEDYAYDVNDDLVRATVQLPIVGEDEFGLEDAAQFTFTWQYQTTDVEKEVLPYDFALEPAYPNPFNPATSVTYRLAAPGHVAVRVYDALGRLVATLVDEHRTAGPHKVGFDAGGLPGGLYLIRLEAAGLRRTRAVTLLK